MATYESISLGGTELNDFTNYRVVGMDAPPPRKRYEWIDAADSDGGALARDPLYENRTITLKVRIAPQATMNAALQKISAIGSLLQEADVTPGGLALVWGPCQTTVTQTAYVLSGEITEMPITKNGGDQGWFFSLPTPVITLVLYCRPFLYGSEVTEALGASATPILTDTLVGVPGDVPAEARLVIADNAGQARRYLEWGIEQRYYDASTSLIVDSDNMVTAGFSGTQSTITGAYDPNAAGTNAIRATIYSTPVSICGTGNLAHVGMFRVKGRVQTSLATATTWTRFCWRAGSGQYHQNAWVKPTTQNGWCEVDFGTITIPDLPLGTQQWDGFVQAYSTTNEGTFGVAPGTFDVDYLVLVPVLEGYGRARADYVYQSGGMARFDDFDTGALLSGLSGRTADLGGTWTLCNGLAIDWSKNSATQMIRGAANDNYSYQMATLGASMTDTDVSVKLISGWIYPGVSTVGSGGVCARYSTLSNVLRATVDYINSPGAYCNVTFALVRCVSGTWTDMARTESFLITADAVYYVRLVVYATGRAIATLTDSSGGEVARLSAVHSTLATGGALASGIPGLIDYWPYVTGNTRYYDDFTVATPLPDPLVIYGSRKTEIRWDGIVRADSAATVWGQPPRYRGSRVLIPPAGPNNRTSRVLVKAHREDIEAEGSTYVTDNLGGTLYYTPRYLTPRGTA